MDDHPVSSIKIDSHKKMMVLNYHVVQNQTGLLLLHQTQSKQQKKIPKKPLCCKKYQSIQKKARKYPGYNKDK